MILLYLISYTLLYLLNNIAAILAILIHHIYKKKRSKTSSPTLAHFVKAWPMHNVDDAFDSPGHPCTSRSIRTPSLQVVPPSDLLERVSPAVGRGMAWLWLAVVC